jgi:hypothetical protein
MGNHAGKPRPPLHELAARIDAARTLAKTANCGDACAGLAAQLEAAALKVSQMGPLDKDLKPLVTRRATGILTVLDGKDHQEVSAASSIEDLRDAAALREAEIISGHVFGICNELVSRAPGPGNLRLIAAVNSVRRDVEAYAASRAGDTGVVSDSN